MRAIQTSNKNTSHNQVAVYSRESQLEWRTVGSGHLPHPRSGLRATLVGDIPFLTGGYNSGSEATSVLFWDPVAESWQVAAGKLAVGRHFPAAVAIPDSLVAC